MLKILTVTLRVNNIYFALLANNFIVHIAALIKKGSLVFQGLTCSVEPAAYNFFFLFAYFLHLSIHMQEISKHLE